MEPPNSQISCGAIEIFSIPDALLCPTGKFPPCITLKGLTSVMDASGLRRLRNLLLTSAASLDMQSNHADTRTLSSQALRQMLSLC